MTSLCTNIQSGSRIWRLTTDIRTNTASVFRVPDPAEDPEDQEDECRRLEVDKVDEGPCQLQQPAPTAARRWLWLLCGSPPPPSMDKPSCLPQEIPFCNASTLFRKNSYTTHLWSLILILEGISLLVYSPALSICFGVICLPLIIMGRYYFSPAVFLYACAFGLPFVTHKISWPS